MCFVCLFVFYYKTNKDRLLIGVASLAHNGSFSTRNMEFFALEKATFFLSLPVGLFCESAHIVSINFPWQSSLQPPTCALIYQSLLLAVDDTELFEDGIPIRESPASSLQWLHPNQPHTLSASGATLLPLSLPSSPLGHCLGWG